MYALRSLFVFFDQGDHPPSCLLYDNEAKHGGPKQLNSGIETHHAFVRSHCIAWGIQQKNITWTKGGHEWIEKRKHHFTAQMM